MKEVKDFIEEFCIREAEATTLVSKPNLEESNRAIEQLYTYVDGISNLGLRVMRHLKDPEYYETYKDFPPKKPRYLFKISHYKHIKYEGVWVAYTSEKNPKRKKLLCVAFFVIYLDGEPKIVKEYSYSNYSTYDSECPRFQWEEREGYNDLTFESLEGPLSIERYQEPSEILDSLKLYHEDV